MAEKKLDAYTIKLLEEAGELIIDGQLVKANAVPPVPVKEEKGGQKHDG